MKKTFISITNCQDVTLSNTFSVVTSERNSPLHNMSNKTFFESKHRMQK